MDVVQILKKLGFDDKEIRLYLVLLSLGPSPVRKIAQATGINRGTAYDIIKQLIKQGLVVYYHKEKKQYFVLRIAPERFLKIMSKRLLSCKLATTKPIKILKTQH